MKDQGRLPWLTDGKRDEPASGGGLVVATVLLSAVAVWSVESAMDRSALWAGLWIVLSLVGRALVGWSRLKWESAVVAVLSMLVVMAPIGADLTRNRPLEISLLASGRNALLVLLVFSARPSLTGIAGFTAAVMLLIAGRHADPAVRAWQVAAFAGVAPLWLLSRHWDRLRTAQGRTTSLPVIGWVLGMAFSGFIATTVMLAAGRTGEPTWNLLESSLPLSGGSQRFDLLAREGVGEDGDRSVSGEDADSVGQSDSDTVLESRLPSLFDALTEQFRTPDEQRSPAVQRAQFQGTIARHSHGGPRENLHPGRNVSLRRAVVPRTGGSSRDAQALYYVEGSAPLWIRQTTYREFDGQDWLPEPDDPVALTLTVDAWGWLTWPENPARDISEYRGLFGRAEQHRVLVGRGRSAHLPLPTNVECFRISRLTRVRFFRWASPGVLRMRYHDHLPATSRVEFRTVRPREAALKELSFPELPGGGCEWLGLPSGLSPEIGRLAEAWSAEHPRGWKQIRAVIDRLRSDYQFRPGVAPPANLADPLGHFLLVSREGGDHHFASAAVVMLRHLGYEARLVSGYYADPSQYDSVNRHVPIDPEDVHVWAEVRLPNGAWVHLEPCPGYPEPSPWQSWTEEVTEMVGAVGKQVVDWLGRPGVITAVVGTLCLGGVFWLRRVRLLLVEWVWWVRWQLLGGRNVRQDIIATMRLLEWRFALRGRSRPVELTPRRWWQRQGGRQLREMVEFFAAHDWAVFAEGRQQPPQPPAVLADLCRLIARTRRPK